MALNNYEQRLQLVYLHGHLVERMAAVFFQLNKDRNISLERSVKQVTGLTKRFGPETFLGDPKDWVGGG